MSNATDSKARSRGVKRACVKLVRYTTDELRLVNERAAAAGRPVACYIREASLGAALRARHTPANETLVRQLVLVGNQLTALARTAHDAGLPQATDFEAGVQAVLETIRQLGDGLK